MNRVRLFGSILGLSGLLVPARMAIGDEIPVEPTMDQHLVGVWSVTVEPDQATAQAGRNPFRDYLLFEANGQFTAEAFGPMGFGQSSFNIETLSEGVTAFTTTMANEGQGTLVWNGVRQGSRLVGSLVWTRGDGSVCTYNFNADRLDD